MIYFLFGLLIGFTGGYFLGKYLERRSTSEAIKFWKKVVDTYNKIRWEE